MSTLAPKIELYLEQRLRVWADWYSQGNSYRLGYPPVSITYFACYQQTATKMRNQPRVLPSHQDAEEIDDIVREMVKCCPILAKVLRCQYFTLGTLRQKAEKMQLSQTQFRSYVEMSKLWLAGRLMAV